LADSAHRVERQLGGFALAPLVQDSRRGEDRAEPESGDRGGDRPDARPAGGDSIVEMTQDGRETRNRIAGIREWPPARSFASSRSPRRETAWSVLSATS